MTSLATIIANPIDWHTSATDPDMKTFLLDLQANILKGHGRHHSGHIFLSFAGMTPDRVAALLRTLAAHCTSADRQLRTNRKYPPHVDAGVVRCLFLTASGYAALGELATLPGGEAFAAGMGGRTATLSDPQRQDWSKVGWRETPPDAMLLVADASADAVTDDLEAMESFISGSGARVLFVERGLQQMRKFRTNEKAEGVEHFGYVDGRSQPLVLTDDIAAEPHANWNPAFAPSQFLVPDPNGRSALSAGSYFVFRKLEQDVLGFNAAEDLLGHEIFGDDATDDELERAGAMVVGRFEDGTPLTLSAAELNGPVPNDFTYDGDAGGSRCPFHAHIRKTNPRGDVRRELGLPNDDGDRNPIMIRRGITYGAQRPMTPDGGSFADGGSEPVHHSGLLFMAYMANIEAQFEFTQQSWANNPAFVGNLNPANGHPPVGIDPIIGQLPVPPDNGDLVHLDHTWLDGWTQDAVPKVAGFERFVHMQGGEYFFAPSLSFLRGVGL